LGAGATLDLPRSAGKRPLHVVVVPTPPNVQSLRADRAAVSLFITDPERRVRLDVRELRESFDLTPAEARLAEFLVQGLDVAAISLTLGVSVHTTRSQLKQVFSKTATSRQSELIALLMKGSIVDSAR
jgi:DNA-binding CsgD family transcriptional regulator